MSVDEWFSKYEQMLICALNSKAGLYLLTKQRLEFVMAVIKWAYSEGQQDILSKIEEEKNK